MAQKVWSGDYWSMASSPLPMAEGPLTRFDQYVKNKIGQDPGCKTWEYNHHYQPGVGWSGHCHGWSAASVLEEEPAQQVQKAGVSFTVGDLKGILSEYHCTSPLDLWVGWRDISNYTADDKLLAHEFHQVIVDWVNQGLPVVMDIMKSYPVWNQPVFKSELTYSAPDSENKIHVTCKIFYALDGAQYRDYIGVAEGTKTYTYWIMGNQNHPIAGDWEGNSLNDHPGFIWHPDYGYPGTIDANPLVHYTAQVDELIQAIAVANQQGAGGGPVIGYLLPGYTIRHILLGRLGHRLAQPFGTPGAPEREINLEEPGLQVALSHSLRFERVSKPQVICRTPTEIARMRIHRIPEQGESGQYPQWQTGTWWQVQVQQVQQSSSTQGSQMSQQQNLQFEVVGESQKDGVDCYHLVVSYPDRPSRAVYKYSEIWMKKTDRKPVAGVHHFGNVTVPMRCDFLMRFVEDTPLVIPDQGTVQELIDIRSGAERRITGFVAMTRRRILLISSRETPFPVSVQAPLYTATLMNWGEG